MLERCNTIEECYEFMLAYAARGLPGNEDSDQAHKYAMSCSAPRRQRKDSPRATSSAWRRRPRASRKIPRVDYRARPRCRDSLAAIELVLAQPSISSQLVDNLNASIHLRALLTDLFLMGEVLRQRLASGPPNRMPT